MTSLVLWLACARTTVPAPAAARTPQPGHLVLAHTNDLHAHFQPDRASWLEGEPSIGGMIEIDAELERLRSTGPLLYLDGGDWLTGTPLMDFEVDGAHGGAMAEFMQLLGCQAWVIGNHEFDLGYDNTAALVAASVKRGIPALSANLRAPDGAEMAMPGLVDHTVIEVGGLRVGVFGITTEDLPTLASADTMSRMHLEGEIEAARAEVAALEPDVDLVVALTHIGVDRDKVLADEVPGIDLIVGAHSHTSLKEPIHEGATWIVQAGSYGKQLGVVSLDESDGVITQLTASLVDLVPGRVTGTPKPEVAALVQQYGSQIEARYGEVISQAASTLGRDYHHESALGRWSADMVRVAAGADVGVYNSGGLRADLVKGPLTRQAVYEVFPFSNQLVRFHTTGDGLRQMVQHNLEAEVGETHGILQTGGMHVTWKLVDSAPAIVSFEVGGAALDPAKDYTVATNDYVVQQWKEYLGIEPVRPEPMGRGIFEVAEEVARRGAVTDPADARMTRLN